MAKTIPQLTDATTVNAADELIIQQGGITKRATGAELAKGLNAINGTVNVKDFGAVGDGVADDTAAIQAAINYTDTQISSSIFFPAGHYRTDAILLKNRRNISFVGEGYKDPVRTRVLISPTTNVANLLEFRSCGYINIVGIRFQSYDMVTDSLVVLRAGGSESVFGSAGACTFINFHGCVFSVGPATSPPANPVLLSNTGTAAFTHCYFQGGSNSAIQLGELNPVNPDTGNPTLTDGVANQIMFEDCLFAGDVYRLNTSHCQWINCNFYTRTMDSNRQSRFSIGSGAKTSQEMLDNCFCDTFDTALFAGTWYTGGLGGGTIIKNSYLAGCDVLALINEGSLEFINNRVVSLGSANFRRIIVLEQGAGPFRCNQNNTIQVDQVNTPVNLAKVGLIDDRRTVKHPVVFREVVKTADIVITNVDVPVLTTTFKSIGQRFKIKASLNIELTDASARTFVAKFVVDGTTVPDTQRRVTLNNTNDLAVLTLEADFFIPQKTAAVNFQIFMRSTAGTTTGLIKQNDSVWQLETIDN